MDTLPIFALTGDLKDKVEDGVGGPRPDAEMRVEADLDDASSKYISKSPQRTAEIHTSTSEKEVEMMKAAMAVVSGSTWSDAGL